MTTKLDEYLEQMKEDYYLNPEGDYAGEFVTFLPDDYAMNEERWHNAIRQASTEELTDKEVNEVVEHICHFGALYEINLGFALGGWPRKKCFASYIIGEIEVQLPEDLESYESDEFHIAKHEWNSGPVHYAYLDCSYEVFCFDINTEELDEFIEDLREEAA